MVEVAYAGHDVDFDGPEHCFRCRQATYYRTDMADRISWQQVPLCLRCYHDVHPIQVPGRPAYNDLITWRRWFKVGTLNPANTPEGNEMLRRWRRYSAMD